MSRRGQVVVIIAFLIPIVLLLLAVGVDAGRIYITRAEYQRAAEAAASAGISVVADRMVTQAVLRQTAAAGQSSSTPLAGATSTPEAGRPAAWLSDDDRATLVSPTMQDAAAAAARALLSANYVEDESGVEFTFLYPQAGYAPDDERILTLNYRVELKARITILLAGLLYKGWTNLGVTGEAGIPQR